MNKTFPSRLVAFVFTLVATLIFAAPRWPMITVTRSPARYLPSPPTSITVKKGKDPWTVSRDASTQVTGDLKVGAKVTIKYHMVADTVTRQINTGDSMGLFDSILGGLAANDAQHAALYQEVGTLVNQAGGVSGLAQQFQQKGLGGVISG